jgi:hypothetical protein
VQPLSLSGRIVVVAVAVAVAEPEPTPRVTCEGGRKPVDLRLNVGRMQASGFPSPHLLRGRSRDDPSSSLYMKRPIESGGDIYRGTERGASAPGVDRVRRRKRTPKICTRNILYLYWSMPLTAVCEQSRRNRGGDFPG